MTSKWATRFPGFTEEWFGAASQAALTDLVGEVTEIEGSIIEVGSWEGRSTVALASAAWPRQIEAIDTWQGSAGEISATLAAGRDVFAQFQLNIAEWTDGNVTAHRMDWRDYENAEPVALAFIDAEHTYREVFDCIEAFLPMMAVGGIICGDDVHHPPVVDAVTEFFPNYEQAATLWIARL